MWEGLFNVIKRNKDSKELIDQKLAQLDSAGKQNG